MLEVRFVLQPETKSSVSSWQDLICRLDGVCAAKVVLSDENVPEEIHILASTTKSPKAITRDVQSALMAVFGVEVDYRIISIAQIDSNLQEKDGRLCYSGIDSKFIDGEGEVTVFLSHGSNRVEGKAFYTTRNMISHLRGVAYATLDAISKSMSINGGGHYDLVTTELMEVGGNPVVLAVLCDEDGRQFVGSAFVRENHDDAMVCAVLDALNRRISRYIT
jgi:hypothetical protein